MNRYINVEKIPKDEFFNGLTDIEKAKVLQWFLQAPTADVVEVSHGKWDYIATHDCFSCNLCKFDSDVAMKYCGGCGAKMDGENA